MNAPTVRPATTSDVPALADLAKRTWSDAFGAGVNADDEKAELDEGRTEAYFAAALEQRTILVAEANGVLQGYVQFGDATNPDMEARPEDQELQRLYVETALQGRGLGRRLMTAALDHPRLSQATRIYLQVWEENERALRLYESLGFRRVGTTSFTIGASEMEDLVLLLDRTPPPA